MLDVRPGDRPTPLDRRGRPALAGEGELEAERVELVGRDDACAHRELEALRNIGQRPDRGVDCNRGCTGAREEPDLEGDRVPCVVRYASECLERRVANGADPGQARAGCAQVDDELAGLRPTGGGDVDV